MPKPTNEDLTYGLGRLESGLAAWYESELGKSYYAIEAHQLAHVLEHCFGYHLLQLAGPEQMSWLAPCPIRHQLRASFEQNVSLSEKIRFNYHAWPLQTECLDAILLPHSHELVSEPFVLFKQAVQALIPEGYLLVLGFNPVSLWGIGQRLPIKSAVPPVLHDWRIGRVRRALEIAGCEVEEIKIFYFRPAELNPRNSKAMHILEALGQSLWPWLGAGYLMVARKHTVSMTPLRLQVQKKRVCAGQNVTATLSRS